jgi:tetratricopeptide (TPR) repeat protein
MDEEKMFTLDEAHRHFATSLNGEVWDLLGNQNRSALDDARLVAAAFASYYHWLHDGSAVNMQRGEYLIARVYLELKNFDEAFAHSRKCLDLTKANSMEMTEFDVAYAYEIYSRVNAARGNPDTALEYFLKARLAGEKIPEKEDRDLFLADFTGGEWYGFDNEL